MAVLLLHYTIQVINILLYLALFTFLLFISLPKLLQRGVQCLDFFVHCFDMVLFTVEDLLCSQMSLVLGLKSRSFHC